MYTTCLFCHGDLGSNTELEEFPVGRRLAYDAAKGRLWVVCRRCERWNLTPLEERWEAIESAERLFRDTRLRVSTDNIGLARLAGGLELVRIGSPQRPELAAWRYGDQFGRRRRKHLLLTGAGVAAAAGFLIAGPLTGLIAGGSWGVINVANTMHSMYEARRVRVRMRLPGNEELLVMRRMHLSRTRLVGVADDRGWVLRVAHARPDESGRVAWAPPAQRATNLAVTELWGDDALRAAGRILPQMNAKGAPSSAVQSAVRLLEETPDPRRFFARNASRWDRVLAPGSAHGGAAERDGGAPMEMLPLEVRLALEMAAHEDEERRALEGELSLLEAAWRQAEEIAAIADDLLVPEPVRARLASTPTDASG